MDCREFRDKHFAFVDDILSGIELVGIQMHLNKCPKCARQDAAVRRSLMLARSLPRIEPSPDFGERLQRKLQAAKAADREATTTHKSRTFAAAVAITSAVMLGYIGVSLRQVDSQRHILLPPVFATIPETHTVTLTTSASAMLASVPAGLPIWTAAMVAEQTPVHFASLDRLHRVNSR